MFIFLYGPSGSGKSTVGKMLAQSLNWEFQDLDSAIEIEAGQSISELIHTKGERSFRDLETAVLQKSIQEKAQVVALGGGTLLNDDNRNFVQSVGEIVFLDTPSSVLSSRLLRDKSMRPLLVGDLEFSLLAQLEERKAHYGSFTLRVDGSGTPEQVSWEIQRLLGRFHLSNMGRGYDVMVMDGGLDSIGGILRPHISDSPVLIVSDTTVAPLYSDRVISSLQEAGIRAKGSTIPPGEAYKTLETVSSLWREYLNNDLDRKSTIIALGGGVVGDLAGFSAATFMRGCKWVSIPTTLLAMVDAGIGGKTGFDLPEGKNLIGAFHSPSLVLADPNVLQTLSERELRAGMAEVVKHGIIGDPTLFELCARGWDYAVSNLAEIVRRGAAVKVKIVEGDPFEQGFRAALNFGHTVGHALELVSNYTFLHGEAVSVGMVVEARLAERLSIAHAGLSDRIKETLSKLRLPVAMPKEFAHEDLINAMKIDKKKSQGTIRFAFPEKIGAMKVGIEVRDLMSVFEEEK